MLKISKGVQPRPFLGVVYGPDGAGKTSLAASFPSPIFLGAEKGTAHLDVVRAEGLTKFEDFVLAIESILKEDHDFKTLVIDSLDWLEPVLWDYVCRQNQWKDIEDPGYGKGYVIALLEWDKLIKMIEQIVEKRGMNVVVIAHSQVKTVSPPGVLTPYDRYQMKLNEKAAAKWREFVDAVLFVNYEVFVKTDKGAKKGKAVPVDEQTRVIYTERMPAHDAKNRFGLPKEIPLEYPNGYEGLMRYVKAGPVDVTLDDLKELSAQIKDENVKKKIDEALKSPLTPDQAASYKKRMQTIIETQTL